MILGNDIRQRYQATASGTHEAISAAQMFKRVIRVKRESLFER